MKAGEERTVSLRRRADGPAAGPASAAEQKAEAPKPAATGGSSRKSAGYIIGGVGAVGLAVGGITAIVLAGKKSQMDSANCDAGKRTCTGPSATDGVSAASLGAPLVGVFYGGLAVGVVGAAVGTYLVLSATDDGAVSLRVSPRGASLEGTF